MTIYCQDTFTRANTAGNSTVGNAAGWGTSSDSNTWTQILGNTYTYSISSNTGKLLGSIADQFIYLTSTSHATVEVLISVTANSSSSSNWFGASLRYNTGSNNGYIAYLKSGTSGAFVMSSYTSGSGTSLTSQTGLTITSGQKYWIRFQANGTALKARYWQDGNTEPGTWNLNATDSTYTTGVAGLYLSPDTTATSEQYASYQANDTNSTVTNTWNAPADTLTITDASKSTEVYVPTDTLTNSETPVYALTDKNTDTLTSSDSVSKIYMLLDVALTPVESSLSTEVYVPVETLVESEINLPVVIKNFPNVVGDTVTSDTLTFVYTNIVALADVALSSSDSMGSSETYTPVDALTEIENVTYALSETYVDTALASSDSITGVNGPAGPIFAPEGNKLVLDTFVRSNQSGWGTSAEGVTWLHPNGAGTLSIVSNRGDLVSSSSTKDDMVYGNTAYTDSVAQVTVSLGVAADLASLGIRANSTAQNKYRATINGPSSSFDLVSVNAGTPTTLATKTGLTFTAGTQYTIKVQAIGSMLWAKYWAVGTAEPTAYTLGPITDTTWSSGYFTVNGLATTSTAVTYTNLYAIDYALADTPMTPSDSLSFVSAPNVITVNFTDVALATQDTIALTLAALNTDILVGSDASSTALTQATTDAITENEAFASTEVFAPSDTALLPSDAFIGTENATLVDTLAPTEQAAYVLAIMQTDVGAETEAVTFIETVIITDVPLVATESLVATETINNADTIVSADALSITLSDSNVDALVAIELYTESAASSLADTALNASESYSATGAAQSSDTNTSSDTISVVGTLSLTDTLSASDQLQATLQGSAIDTTLLSDAIASSFTLLAIDVATTSDKLALTVTLFATDASSLSDTLNNSTVLAFSDLLTSLDALFDTVNTLATDTVLSSDTLTSLAQATYNFSDQTIISDAVAATLASSTTDILAQSDQQITTEITLFTDQLVSTDTLSSSNSSAYSYFTATDQLTANESISFALSLSSTDTVVIADVSTSTVQALEGTSLLASDSVTTTGKTLATDASSVNETLLEAIAYSVTDIGATLSDVAVTAITANVSDALVETESVNVGLTQRAFDNTNEVEAISEAFFVIFADALTLTDTLNGTLATAPGVLDTQLAIQDTGQEVLLALSVDNNSTSEFLSTGNTLTDIPLASVENLLAVGNVRSQDALVVTDSFSIGQYSVQSDALTEVEAFNVSAVYNTVDNGVLLESYLATQGFASFDITTSSDAFLATEKYSAADTMVSIDMFGVLSVVSLSDQSSLADKVTPTFLSITTDAPLNALESTSTESVWLNTDILNEAEIFVFHTFTGTNLLDVGLVPSDGTLGVGYSLIADALFIVDSLDYSVKSYTLTHMTTRSGNATLAVNGGNATLTMRDGNVTLVTRSGKEFFVSRTGHIDAKI